MAAVAALVPLADPYLGLGAAELVVDAAGVHRALLFVESDGDDVPSLLIPLLLVDAMDEDIVVAAARSAHTRRERGVERSCTMTGGNGLGDEMR